MNAGLDTSVVVRLLIGEPQSQAAVAWQFVTECFSAGLPAQVSELVVAEAYFVLQHHYEVPVAAALQQLNALLTDERVVAHGAILKVLRTPNLAASKPGFVDRLIYETYHARDKILVTFDKGAARLPNSHLLKG